MCLGTRINHSISKSLRKEKHPHQQPNRNQSKHNLKPPNDFQNPSKPFNITLILLYKMTRKHITPKPIFSPSKTDLQFHLLRFVPHHFEIAERMSENFGPALDSVIEEVGAVTVGVEGGGGCLAAYIGFAFDESDLEFIGVIRERCSTGHSSCSASHNQNPLWPGHFESM